MGMAIFAAPIAFISVSISATSFSSDLRASGRRWYRHQDSSGELDLASTSTAMNCTYLKVMFTATTTNLCMQCSLKLCLH